MTATATPSAIERLNAIQARQAEIEKKQAELAKPVYPPNANPAAVLPTHGPTIRVGENIMGSRGFSFLKLAGHLSGKGSGDAKIERDVHQRLYKSLVLDLGTGRGYRPAGGGTYTAFGSGGQSSTIGFAEGVMCPLAMDYLPEEVIGQQIMHEIKSLTWRGVENADPNEMAWLRQKMYSDYGQKTVGPQSYLSEQLGGPLIAPPEQGELIQLLRNKEALINAGVRTIPLPPQGSIVFPRQTSATTGYYVGENTTITPSQFGTGQLALRAKKVAVITTLPNELIRFGGPAAEALLREDMAKTLALTMDYYLLSQGSGTDVTPLSILGTSGVVSLNTSNPNVFSPQDIYKFPSAIMANNAEIEGYIMRPESFWSIQAIRTGTGAGAGTGLFAFNPGRDLNSKFNFIVGGLPCVLTPQVSNTQPLTANGAANSATYILGGMWSDYILGMFGAIEFAATAVSDSTFGQDQTAVRAILSHDGGMRHPGAFAFMNYITSFQG